MLYFRLVPFHILYCLSSKQNSAHVYSMQLMPFSTIHTIPAPCSLLFVVNLPLRFSICMCASYLLVNLFVKIISIARVRIFPFFFFFFIFIVADYVLRPLRCPGPLSNLCHFIPCVFYYRSCYLKVCRSTTMTTMPSPSPLPLPPPIA